jgi:predicted transglutaminase-like cysteine proteinase
MTGDFFIRLCSQKSGRRLALLARAMLVTLAIWLSGAPAAETGGFMVPEDQLPGIRSTYGDHALRRIRVWERLINSGRGLEDQQKLERANSFFNELSFSSDLDHWGQEDYWATPLQTLASNGGDCEDFSIAKYFTLREMGIPAERLRLTYVKALELNQAHMVLTYFATPDADPLVLDNLNGDILPASGRQDLLPVYSFNGNGLWLTTARGMEQHIGKPERLSHWQSVVARISDEQLAAAH